MLIKVPAFQARHGEGGQLVMRVLSCFQFGKGHSHQAHIEMESQLSLRAGLAVAQTRKLFGITEQEFNLEARFVKAIEACRSEIGVGAKEERRAVRAGLDDHDDAHVAFELHMVDHLGVEDNPLIAGRHPLKASQIRPMHFAVLLLRTAGPGTWRAMIEVAEVCITAQFANLMELYGLDTIEEFLFAVIAIGDHVA